jgi:D-beta-D-heptose 7-phosphate kinase/D-beta-D-heptose 1-phosphate adenosyltransferase
MRLVAVSGGFDVLHDGHCRMIQEAAKYGPVVVILNSDDWLVRKKGYYVLNWEQRKVVLMSISGVIDVVSVDDSDGTVCEALNRVKPCFFANGGDRKCENTPEVELCNKLGINLLFSVGGGKDNSSTDIAERILKFHGKKK